MLGVFPEDATVPLDVIAALWLKVGGIADEGEARDVLDRLADVQIVAYSSEVRASTPTPLRHSDSRCALVADLRAQARGAVSLIDLTGDYLRCRGKSDAAEWHAAVLDGCPSEVPPVGGGYWGSTPTFLHHLKLAAGRA
eukprot:4556749-Prymnesium_polylepis.1